MGHLIASTGPIVFDHVVLGTRDTADGAAQVAELCGTEPIMTEPEPGQWYHSAALPLGGGAMLEILGPNTDHQGFRFFKSILARYDRPEPVFWHLGTADFDAFCAVAKAAGAPVERIEHLNSNTPHGRRTYTRGILGPGFRTVRPCVIEWTARPKRPGLEADPVCSIKAFKLTSPKAAEINKAFQALGVDLTVENGTDRLSLVLWTPRGEVTFAGPGLVFEGAAALFQIAAMRLRQLLPG
ncbi:MAG: VOC family protein [Pseudomonadota bacterium]